MKRYALLVVLCLAACSAPTPTPNTPNPETPSSASASESSYIGLTIAAAQTKATAEGVPFRVVELDGEPQAVTMDYRPGRLNATVERGVIVRIDVEGEGTAPPLAPTYDQDSWKVMIPETCKSFFDGCNSCTRMEGGVGCTKMACQTYQKPECRD